MAVTFAGKPVSIRRNMELAGILPEDIKASLYYASLAPSSHNAQNWKVRVDSEQHQMYIILDESRILQEVDPARREAYISIGAFAENLRQALTCFGYQVDITADGSGIKLLYHKSRETLPENGALRLMETRHTDKRNYNTAPLQEETVAAMLSEFEDLRYYAKGTSGAELLTEGTLQAYTIQANNQAKRDELADWLRFSDAETLQYQDGLPAEQLGMRGVKKAFYYWFTNRSSAKGDRYAKQGISMTAAQLEHCAGFFVILGHNTPAELIHVGMTLQHFWLNAVQNNIALHPMSQMLEELPYSDKIAIELQTGQPVQMILRAGTVREYGENNKIRRDLKDFVEITR